VSRLCYVEPPPMNEQAAPKTNQGFDALGGLLTVLRALRKHWPAVIACAVLGAGVAFFYSKTLPRVYEAAALVELDPNVVHPLSDKTEGMMPLGAGFLFDNSEYYETQYRIVTSQAVMLAVARDLNLAADPEFAGPGATAETAGGILAGHVRVEPVKGSRLFYIYVDDIRPARARRIAEAIATTYIDQNLKTAISATSDAALWLSDQVDHLKNELASNEDALHKFKEDNNLPSTSINDAYNMVRVEMEAFDTALTKTRTHKQELLARHEELAKISTDNPEELPASELLNDAFLSSLRTQYQTALKDRSSLLAEGKGENHPLVKSVDGKIAETKAALLGEIKNIQGSVEKDLAVIEHEEAGEEALFEASRKRAVDLNLKEIEYHRLDRARQENEKLYAVLLERMKEADLARMMNVNNIHLVEKPVEPATPVRPRVIVNIGIGLAFGLLLGLGITWLREILDSSIKTPDDVESVLGLTVLGLLPEISEQDDVRKPGRRRRRVQEANGATGHPELIVHERPTSGIAEAARSVRTNLMFMNPDRPHRTLLVTSAAPSEGKTTVACNVAIALAQGGQRVCLVDCDLRRPRLHRIFGREGDAGVTNVVVGEAGIDDVARPTGIENLWCIPSGPIPPNPADMLHSERFRKFIADLGDHFDRVIIDSPPLIAVTDSAIASRLVDGTIFVIRAFKTTRALSRQGLRTLADVDAPVVGTVLNAVNFGRHEYNYYHYYYYKREGYAPLPSKESEEEASEASPPN
jgi:polysaccharide biosynthesis transport protein